MSNGENRWRLRLATATPQEVSAEPAAFPVPTAELSVETFFPDWRRRLARNLSRRSDSRWEPLTWVHAAVKPTGPMRNAAMQSRPFDEHRDTRLWSAIEESINELIATREVSVNTATDYVIGYLCQELAARKLIVAAGAER